MNTHEIIYKLIPLDAINAKDASLLSVAIALDAEVGGFNPRRSPPHVIEINGLENLTDCFVDNVLTVAAEVGIPVLIKCGKWSFVIKDNHGAWRRLQGLSRVFFI